MKKSRSRKPPSPRKRVTAHSSVSKTLIPSIRQKTIIASCVVLASAFLLFFNLGHYALWDDESETALNAQGVLATGDTTAVIGHNIQARRGGINLIHLHDRVTPPLPTYIMAASFRIFGVSSFAARLPSVLCGLLTVGLILWWMWKSNASLQFWLLMAVALIGNVSLFLYFRQARYYGPALFLAVLLVYFYLNWKPTPRHAACFSFIAGALFMCHPIAFAQAATVIGLDFLLFNRQQKIFSLRTFPFLTGPATLIITGTLLVWNPLASKAGGYLDTVTFQDRIILLYRYFRDINASEFLVGGLVVAAPIAYALSRNIWILRCLAAIVITVVVTSVISYQNVKMTSVADIRYTISVIPLGIMIGVLTIQGFIPHKIILSVAVALVVFWTNLLNGGIFMTSQVSSSLKKFTTELLHPVPEPYTPVAAWIREQLPPDTSVWVVPDYMAYPLMFHAPQAIYAWQIPNRSDPQFAGLPAINFQGEVLPDYIIVFGPSIQSLLPTLKEWEKQGVNYKRAENIPVFWKDLYRPELFWRTFVPITGFNPDIDGVNIFKKQSQ